jgi:hypothetical protein
MSQVEEARGKEEERKRGKEDGRNRERKGEGEFAF